MKVVAVIPCLNAQTTVANVAVTAAAYCDKVVVVDNGSTDNSVAKISSWEAVYSLAVVFCHTRGVGAATRMGMAECLDADVVVTLDSDGQHDPREIPAIVQPIVDGVADIAVGSRFIRPYTGPPYRRFGISVITWAYNLGHQQKLTDSQSCFRAYRRDALDKLLPIISDGFTYSVETLIKARSLGMRVVEVPITCIYNADRRQNSTMPPLRHGLTVLTGVILWRMLMIFRRMLVKN